MKKEALNEPPFPALRWDDYFWTGEIVLPSWAGFQARGGPYGSVSSHTESDGKTRLIVVPADTDARTPPSSEQAEAFRFLRKNEGATGQSVLKAIFKDYPSLRESYGYNDDEAEELMPVIEQPAQLRRLIGLSNLHVLTVAKDGVAYIGFEFGCSWDEESGLGVMTHRGRVVEVGGADTSFDASVAEEDAETDN